SRVLPSAPVSTGVRSASVSARRTRASKARSGSATRASSSISAAVESSFRPAASAGSASRSAARAVSSNPARASAAVTLCARTEPSLLGCAAPSSSSARSAQRDAGQLVRGDLGPVVVPLLALIGQEVPEGLFAEGVGHQFGGLHHLHRLGEVARQRVQAQGAAFVVRERPHVVLGLLGQFVVSLDAFQAGAQ